LQSNVGHGAITHLGLAFLSLASGSTDVLAFLELGNVFTSAMTGNTAMLAIGMSQGRMVAALQPLLALFGFVAGAALATTMYNPNRARVHALGALRPLFLVEIFCLGSFAVTWGLVDHPPESAVLYCLILLSAIGMGVQGVAARHIDSPGISTIVFTGTLVSVATSVTAAIIRPSDNPGALLNAKRQIGMFLAYGFGATLAGFLIWRELDLVVWIPLAAVLFASGCCEFARKLEGVAS
jgi:uncharacterized membrane protein YoaK (UPF0700 family)